ncbi:MAG: FAD-dependent oxidoreductase [Oscillospiraceae bacterium]|nr:FAD-dependent oxidoreductase [Oscillospiraceae bacterium]
MFDVAIVGAGVIGGMLARELSRYKLSVCLLEKENDVAMGASKANSGIVHGGYDPEPGTLKAKLNSVGVEQLFQTAKELNVPIIRNGSMVCAFSKEEEPLLQELYKRGQVNSIPGLKLISGDEARALEPNLSPAVTKVLHVTNAGIVGPYELTIAAVGNAMDNGVELKRNFDVAAISKTDVFTVTAHSGEQVQCRYLVNCAGGGSDKVAALAGDGFFTVIPRAGEYMLLDKAEGSRVSHTLFQCPTKEGKGILVSPTAHGNLLVGPTAKKVASPDSKDTTPAGLAEVERLAAKSVPSVNFRQVITSFTGVRASEKNSDFILCASSKVPGLIHAGAIDSPGLTCCVSIAKYLVDILTKEGLALQEKVNWNGTRKDSNAFQKMSDEEKDAFIKANPAYGKVVCRCETISEGEILDAIRTNPGAMDMDGVKHRTRSGMGRCQGGFCGPYVMELLAREMGIPMEEVTKNGGASAMVMGRIGEV